MKKMDIISVINTKDNIYGFSSKLRLKFANINGQIATVNSAFDEKFIGKLLICITSLLRRGK